MSSEDESLPDAEAEKRAADEAERARWTAAGIPDPLPWKRPAETGRHLADVEGDPCRAKVFCVHNKKTPRLIAMVLDNGTLITHDSIETSVTYAVESVRAVCPLCARRLGAWELDPEALRARLELGKDLDFIPASEVAVRPPL